MSLKERFEQLGERERKLLLVFLVVFFGLFAVLVPLWIRMGVSDQAAANEAISEVIREINDERLTIAKRKQVLARLDARYRRITPALAGFLANQAEKIDLDIPETQDRSTVPHGKTFKERQTRIRLSKASMRKIADFMEAIENAGYPVAITRLDIKKGTSPDQFDVEMDVSAFDREEAKPKPKATAKKPGESSAKESGE